MAKKRGAAKAAYQASIIRLRNQATKEIKDPDLRKQFADFVDSLEQDVATGGGLTASDIQDAKQLLESLKKSEARGLATPKEMQEGLKANIERIQPPEPPKVEAPKPPEAPKPAAPKGLVIEKELLPGRDGVYKYVNGAVPMGDDLKLVPSTVVYGETEEEARRKVVKYLKDNGVDVTKQNNYFVKTIDNPVKNARESVNASQLANRLDGNISEARMKASQEVRSLRKKMRKAKAPEGQIREATKNLWEEKTKDIKDWLPQSVATQYEARSEFFKEEKKTSRSRRSGAAEGADVQFGETEAQARARAGQRATTTLKPFISSGEGRAAWSSYEKEIRDYVASRWESKDKLAELEAITNPTDDQKEELRKLKAKLVEAQDKGWNEVKQVFDTRLSIDPDALSTAEPGVRDLYKRAQTQMKGGNFAEAARTLKRIPVSDRLLGIEVPARQGRKKAPRVLTNVWSDPPELIKDFGDGWDAATDQQKRVARVKYLMDQGAFDIEGEIFSDDGGGSWYEWNEEAWKKIEADDQSLRYMEKVGKNRQFAQAGVASQYDDKIVKPLAFAINKVGMVGGTTDQIQEAERRASQGMKPFTPEGNLRKSLISTTTEQRRIAAAGATFERAEDNKTLEKLMNRGATVKNEEKILENKKSQLKKLEEKTVQTSLDEDAIRKLKASIQNTERNIELLKKHEGGAKMLVTAQDVGFMEAAQERSKKKLSELEAITDPTNDQKKEIRKIKAEISSRENEIKRKGKLKVTEAEGVATVRIEPKTDEEQLADIDRRIERVKKGRDPNIRRGARRISKTQAEAHLKTLSEERDRIVAAIKAAKEAAPAGAAAAAAAVEAPAPTAPAASTAPEGGVDAKGLKEALGETATPKPAKPGGVMETVKKGGSKLSRLGRFVGPAFGALGAYALLSEIKANTVDAEDERRLKALEALGAISGGMRQDAVIKQQIRQIQRMTDMAALDRQRLLDQQRQSYTGNDALDALLRGQQASLAAIAQPSTPSVAEMMARM